MMPKSHSLIKPCASLGLPFLSPTQVQHLSQKPIQVCEPNYRALTLLSFLAPRVQNYYLGGTRLFNATVSSSRPRLPSSRASLRFLSRPWTAKAELDAETTEPAKPDRPDRPAAAWAISSEVDSKLPAMQIGLTTDQEAPEFKKQFNNKKETAAKTSKPSRSTLIPSRSTMRCCSRTLYAPSSAKFASQTASVQPRYPQYCYHAVRQRSHLLLEDGCD